MQKKHIKVSVILPCYNVEPYLAQCLDSLIGQTLHDIEIICVDDKSTDNSLKIMREYAKRDKRIRIITSNKNHGQGLARNRGIQLARGEYIGFVDPDDWVSLDYYETLYNQAQNLDSEIVIANYVIYNVEKRTISTVPFWKRALSNHNSIPVDIAVGQNIERDLMLQTLLISPCFAWLRIYKADFIKNNDVLFADIRSQQDCIFVLKAMLLAKNISYCPFGTYFYRVHQKSTVRTLPDMYKNNIKVFHGLKEFLDSHDVDLNKNLDYFITKNLSWSYSNVPNESKYEFWDAVNQLDISPKSKLTLKQLLKKYKQLKQRKYYLFGCLPLYSTEVSQ